MRVDDPNAAPADEDDDDAPADEVIRVIVDGGDADGVELDFWQSVEVSRGLDRCASSFSLAVGRGRMRESGMTGLPIKAFDTIRVLIGDDLVMTASVDKIKRSRTAEAHGVNIQGRSVTADLVDCAAINSPGQWSGATLLRIATDLAMGPGPDDDRQFGIPIIAGPDAGKVVPNFEIEQGETVHDCIERLCRHKGLVLFDTPTGALALSRPAESRAEVTLRHKDGPDGAPDPDNNVLESDVTVDVSKRYSEIICKGQKEGGIGDAGAKGSARDHGVPRFRPFLVSPDGQAGIADCTSRARWECARREGKSLRLDHTVKGWRQIPGGPLWEIGLVVPVEDDSAEVWRDMLVTDVKFALDKQGRRTMLGLEPPEAWAPQPFVAAKGEGGGKWGNIKKYMKD